MKSLVLVEFANITEAQNWHNSPDYIHITHVYVDNAMDIALVDGVSPDFTMAGFAQMSGDCGNHPKKAWCCLEAIGIRLS